MVLSKRAPLVASLSLVVSLGMLAGEGEALAQRKTQKGNKPASEPTTAPANTEPTATPSGTTVVDPSAAPAKTELDTSVETAKAVYMSADVGFTRSDLGALSNSTGFGKTAANGALYGLGAGVRLGDVRLGLRWRVYDTTEFSLWTFAASAGYALPLRPVTPIFSAHVGYVFDQSTQAGLIRNSLPPGTLLPPDIDLKGLLLGLDVNASYWVTQFLRLGVFVGADLMFLSREQVRLPQTVFGVPPEVANLPLYNQTGSGVGLNMNIGFRGAFDIGFK